MHLWNQKYQVCSLKEGNREINRQQTGREHDINRLVIYFLPSASRSNCKLA